MSFKFVVLFLALMQVGASAQKPRSETPRQGRHANKQTSVIRQDALATLDSVLDQLSEIDDLPLRISLTETVVNLLSKSRPQRCRRALDLLFAKAMELRGDPSTHERELQASDSSEIRRIIQIAAVLDKSLAELYIKRYTEALDLKAEPSAGNTDLSSAYVKVATQLVEEAPALAVLTASRSLRTGLTPDTLVFLAMLRKKDVALANRFFVSALQSCQARNARDVNELLLLYAYVFTPLRIPVVTPGGIGILSVPEYLAVAENYPVDTLLAKQYLETSSRLLLDSNRYLPENLVGLANGLLGDFYFISIIEPRVVEYLPHSAQVMVQQRNVVANYLQALDRANAFASLERWTATPTAASLTGGGSNDRVEYLVSRAEQASNPKVKNQLYFRAALAAISDKQDKRALELVNRLSPEYSSKARQLVTLGIAVRKVRDGEFTEAEGLARRDDVLVRRCYVLTLIADSLLSSRVKDTYNAVRLLDDIQQLAGKLSDEKERLSVLEGAAAAYSRLNLAKALDLFRETIQTANKLDKFNGSLSIDQSLDVGGFLFDFSVYDHEFSFFDLLGRLGRSDFYQTLQEAREIRNRSLRIHSIVIVCKAALSAA